MFTRSQVKIYQQAQQHEQAQQQQKAQQQKAQQQKVQQTKDFIQNHLNVLHKSSLLCTSDRIVKINELYNELLSAETKQTLLLPPFSSFRVSLLKKTNELMTQLLVQIQKEKSVERQTTNLELCDNLDAMTRFLQEQVQKQQQQQQQQEQYHQQQQQEHEQQQQEQQEQQQEQPRPPASARSPRKKVSTQVLLRRSARLMAKYA